MADATAPEAEPERVTAESYGALDTSNVDSECWMIRVPQKLAELWDKAPEGTDLGELVFTKGGGPKKVKPSLTVHVSETLQQDVAAAASSATTAASIPLNYSLQAMTKKVPVMHPFVRNPNNGSVQLLGTVSRTANMQVEQDGKYRAMLKDRLVTTNVTNNRYVKSVDVSESVLAKQRRTAAAAAMVASAIGDTSSSSAASSRKRKGFGDAVSFVGKKKAEAISGLSQNDIQQQNQKKTKKARQFAPDQSIRSVLFELFGQQPVWTIKDLKAAAVAGGAINCGTKKGENEIREILREIGEYHRSGDYKNQWSLKSEFQNQS